MYALLDLFFCLTQFDRFAQFIEDQYSFSDRFSLARVTRVEKKFNIALKKKNGFEESYKVYR